MTTKILSAILLLSLNAFGQQNKFDCTKILDKVPYFLTHTPDEQNDSLKTDLDILRTCGNLDSIDCKLFFGPMIGTLLVQSATNNKEPTYKIILDSIHEFKKTDSYLQFRDAIIASNTLENKIVTIDDFEKDKELLVKVGISEEDLNGFKSFIEANVSQKMTYKEAFAKYRFSKPAPQPVTTRGMKFDKLVDLESAMKTGEEKGTRVLLFFSCYACANSRKMEERILNDINVEVLLAEKFSCFTAYTDDKTKDKASNSTIGEKFSKLQTEHFKTDYRPYFCIIDGEGKIISEIGYTNDPREFIEFLNKGLK